MKFLRFLLLGIAALVVLALVVIALAFTSGVQTWAARKFAPATPELTVTLGRVDAGLNVTRLTDVRVVQPGLVLTLPSAEIEASAIDAAGGKVAVRRLVAKGWTLDLTAPGARAAKPHDADQAAKDAFDGVFKLLTLPVDLAVDGVDVSGEVILPAGRTQVALTGGGLAAGKEGKFTLTADLKSGDALLGVKSVLTAGMNSPRSFSKLSLMANASVKSPQVPQGAEAAVALDAVRDSDSETYTVALRSGTRELFRTKINLPSGAAPLVGLWTLDATTADAAPFALGRPLPEVVAKGGGAFSTDRAFARFKATGKIDVTLDQLARVQPELAALGRLVLAANFDAATEGELLRLNLLDVRVSGAQPVVSIATVQPVAFNTGTKELRADNTAGELLRIKLHGLPLAWVKPFLGDLAITGDDVRGEFVASASNGGFTVRPVAPLTLNNLSVSQAGKPLVSALNVSFSAQADYTPRNWSAEVTDFSVGSAGAPVLKFTVKAAQETAGADRPLNARGTYEANLPGVLAQPIAAGAASLKGGVARGEFTASVAKLKNVTLTLQLAGLVAADAASTPLPAVALQVRADVNSAGRITANVPVVITQARRRSDLTLAAVITPSDKGTDIQAKLTSESLAIPDLTLFSALSPAPAQPAAAAYPVKPAPAQPAAPAAPLWDGVTGELKLALKQVIYSDALQLTDVESAVKITPSALTLKNLEASLTTGGELKAEGGLQFDAKQPQPYALKADVAVTEVDAERLMNALSPGGQASPVQGEFALTTQLTGRAAEPAGFGDTVIGDIKLTGTKGTFMALGMKNSTSVGRVGKAAAMAGGLLGAVIGNEAVIKKAGRASAAANVVQQLTAIPFDQLTLSVGRDEKNNLGIKDFSMLSTLLRLSGAGQITYQPGVPLVQQPLLVTLQLGVKGQLADDLRTLNLIEGEPDALGFAPVVEPVTLSGSLQSFSATQFSKLLERALAN